MERAKGPRTISSIPYLITLLLQYACPNTLRDMPAGQSASIPCEDQVVDEDLEDAGRVFGLPFASIT